MTEIIYYKPQIGKQTKDILREISTADQNYLKQVMQCYKLLAELEPRPEFAEWFNTPNPSLPVQPKLNNERNSPRSFCTGIIDKLNQAHNRRDLSPRQCDGIAALSQAISEMYDLDLCPNIVFKDKTLKSAPVVPASFAGLFKNIKK